jgi:hypothetical protein
MQSVEAGIAERRDVEKALFLPEKMYCGPSH